MTGWIEDLDGEITTVDNDGIEASVLTDTLDGMRAAEPSELISLLPGYDPWVLGPGTGDTRIVSPERRRLLTNGANPVLRAGYVVGTWRRVGHSVAIEWFDEAGAKPEAELEGAMERLMAVLNGERG